MTPECSATAAFDTGADLSQYDVLQRSWAAQRLDVDIRPSFLPRVIVGLDISWDSSGLSGYASAVVLELLTLQLLRQPQVLHVHTQMPYVSGYLGFREVPSYMRLVQQLQRDGVEVDAVAVDGFGALHPRGAGAATQLGVLAKLPCIGVGKSLSGACTLRERDVVAAMDESASLQLDLSSLCAQESTSGHGKREVSCVALRKDISSRRPVYVTVGHMCSIDTAVAVIRSCLVFSQPEPIRLADIASRAAVRVTPDQAQAAATAAVHVAIARKLYL